MTSRRVAIGVLAAVPATLAAAFPAPALGMGQVHCAGAQSSLLGKGQGGSVGNLQVDPIVARGVPVSSHMHQFFGSTGIMDLTAPEWASVPDLVGKPTTCDLPADTALYWIPLLTRYGTPLPLKRMEAYYFSWDGQLTDPSMTTQSFPDDLRMVAGNAMATSRRSMDLRHVYWDCGAFSTKSAFDGHWPTPVAANCATAAPILGGRVLLTLAIVFPSCWDGKLNDHTVSGSTVDFNGDPMAATVQHLAYPTAAGCPAGFPVKLMTLRENISWDYRGNGRNVRISSGPGYTAHADFLNSWTAPGLTDMLDDCVNTTMTEQEMHTLHPEICGPPIPCPTVCVPKPPAAPIAVPLRRAPRR
jgi:hypothetical protein